MKKTFYKDAFWWGFILLLIGYVLGMILFAALPATLLGWVISLICIPITIWIVLTKIRGIRLQYYLGVAIVWTLMAIVLDYCFIVLMLHPPDGYYKLDVYVYYLLTFLLPAGIGFLKTRRQLAAH